MRKAKLITLVGMPGAGKSTCVEYLEARNVPSVYFGGITIDEVKARGQEVNEANEKQAREDIRKNEGKDAYAKRILKKVHTYEQQGHSFVVVDGLYSWTEYKRFKEDYGEDAVIIAISAKRKLRHERLADRPVRPLSDKEVTSREYAEIENLEKGGPIANADYTMLNNTTKEELLTQFKTILNEIGFAD